jgi:hypothetical protein
MAKTPFCLIFGVRCGIIGSEKRVGIYAIPLGNDVVGM